MTRNYAVRDDDLIVIATEMLYGCTWPTQTRCQH